MLMQKRQNLVDKFSRFICFTDNSSHIQLSWKTDVELENNMKSKIEVDSEAKENFWAQYFLRILLIESPSTNQSALNGNSERSLSIANKHLSAYLQEACLKAAKDISQELNYIRHKYSLEEYFQIANIAASRPSSIFKNFNFEREQINIQAYAITAFKRFIRNYIYQQDLEARRTRFSGYGLLKYLSAGELTEALTAQSLYTQKVVLFRLTWQCFCDIYQTKSNTSNRARIPSEKEFIAIANYYNQRCSQLNLDDVPASQTTVQERLAICINAVKKYRNRQYLYFEEDYYNISDPTPSKLDLLIRSEECQQVIDIIDKIFTDIPELGQILFKLWQGLGLTQTEIANLLKDKHPEIQKQYQVARHLKRYTRKILKEFALIWNETDSEILLNDEKDIERIKIDLDSCLQLHCRRLIFSILDKINQSFNDKEQEKIFRKVNSKNKLLASFQHYLETNLCLEVNSLYVVNYKLNDILDEWIQGQKGNFHVG